MDLHACLTDYQRYQHQIEQLHKKYLFTPQLYTFQQDVVSLANVVLNASTVAKLIAKAVGDGQLRFEPARGRTIRVKGKAREVFAYTLIDLVVHNTVTALIQEAMAPRLSEQSQVALPGPPEPPPLPDRGRLDRIQFRPLSNSGCSRCNCDP